MRGWQEIAPYEFLDIAKKARMYSIIIRVVLKNSIEVMKKKKNKGFYQYLL